MILEEIRPGVTEKEMAARLQYLMLHFGAEDMSFDPIVVSGPNGSLPTACPRSGTIQAGEFVTMDFGCIYHGYCSDMTRTVAVGFPTEEMRKVYHTVLAAQQAGIAAARAGVTGQEVDAAARAIIRPPDTGLFRPQLRPRRGRGDPRGPPTPPPIDTAAAAGAVISAEPGVYLPGKLGVRIEDVILLTETGCRNLTKAPKGAADFVKTITARRFCRAGVFLSLQLDNGAAGRRHNQSRIKCNAMLRERNETMDTIYITGHRNPDTDSVVSPPWLTLR